MIAAMQASGYSNITAPKTAEERLAELDPKRAALPQRHTTADPQRKTAALSEQAARADGGSGDVLAREALYEQGDYLKGVLHPRNWRALGDRQVPWPANLDPDQAVIELVPFMEYQLLATQEAAQGHNLREMIAAGIYS